MPPPDKERRPPGQEKAADHDAHGGGTKDSVTEDLNIARGIAAAGIPVAVAYPDPEGQTASGRATGYALRGDWQHTTANPAYVDAWRPGLALIAVMGCGLDLVDGDPRNGGDLAALNGIMPEVLAVAATPSGGEHNFVRSMGVRSRDGVLPGIDVKAGDGDGQGRGFAFIAPTVRVSKTTGERVAYRWVKPPDLSRLKADSAGGQRLAALVRQAHGSRGQTAAPFSQPGSHSEGWTDPDIAQLIREGIPAGVAQQPVLRDVVARLAGQGYDRVACWGIWQAIADRTALTKPEWPWAEPDFSDMYDSAVRKYGTRPRQAAQASPADGNRVPDLEDIDGAQLLNDVHTFLCDYVAFPSTHAAAAVTLWAAHTHLAAAFESTPRLALLSPEKQCGKTRVQELLELLCAGAEMLSGASPAYLYRRIGDSAVTILLDEADAIWKRGKADESAEALRSIVNAGHRKGATVGRVEMNGSAAKLLRFPVYAPAAIAGIGDLPDTILDRAVIVRMRRRAPDERVRDYRERITRPAGKALRELLARWAEHVAGHVGDPWPDMPPGVADRAADVWEPLLMVADLAGGDWPKRAAEACTAFVTGARDDTGSTGTRLLADLRDVFGSAPQLFTQTILDRLHAIAEAPWADYSYGKPFSARDLADMLKEHQVKSHQLRIGEDSRKGYRRAGLEDPWLRYLPSRDSETSETSETPLASNVSAVSAVSPPRQDCAGCGEPLDPRYRG